MEKAEKEEEAEEYSTWVILGDDGLCTRTLRSILVLLSCLCLAAKSAALVSTTALVCFGWFYWCRRTSRYVPFFCFRYVFLGSGIFKVGIGLVTMYLALCSLP